MPGQATIHAKISVQSSDRIRSPSHATRMSSRHRLHLGNHARIGVGMSTSGLRHSGHSLLGSSVEPVQVMPNIGRGVVLLDHTSMIGLKTGSPGWISWHWVPSTPHHGPGGDVGALGHLRDVWAPSTAQNGLLGPHASVALCAVGPIGASPVDRHVLTLHSCCLGLAWRLQAAVLIGRVASDAHFLDASIDLS